MLEYLRLQNVGPAGAMVMELAPRMNLLTGDNGLGKSFLCDVAWWALTACWPHSICDDLMSGFPAVPRDPARPATIGCEILSEDSEREHYESRYDAAVEVWAETTWRPPPGAVVIYALSDGGFIVWDPARNGWASAGDRGVEERMPAYAFTPLDVWEGLVVYLEGLNDQVCLGLLEDWEGWIRTDSADGRRMARLIEALSPEGEPLAPGPLVQVSTPLRRWVPSVRTRCAEAVPMPHTSAGVRRMVALAYVLLWSWREHSAAASRSGMTRAKKIVLLIDDLESHLHPRWQRSILRSLLGVTQALHRKPAIQILATTHSPVVLASAEPIFDDAMDRHLHLALDGQGVSLREMAWAKQGDVSSWLVSEAFGLGQARSLEAERAIEAAMALMRGEIDALPAGLTAKRRIDAELKRVLAGHDAFWPRWVLWVEKGGFGGPQPGEKQAQGGPGPRSAAKEC